MQFADSKQKAQLEEQQAQRDQKFQKELAKYKNDLDIEKEKLKGGKTEAPTVKTINGVDKQWNPQTQTWDEIGGGQVGKEQTQKSLDQFKFLRDTIKGATDLADSAGPNMITQGLGNFFVGNTKVKQLEKKLDTLKVNLLTLNTDPSVKKFFGPQMTEKDTGLMTSAGTTMDAYSNSPEDLKSELVRYDDLINRMQTAVKLGQSGMTNLITAPDGNIIQIID